MGKVIAKKIRRMHPRVKFCLVAVFTVLVSVFVLKPFITDSATNKYYFTLDGTAVNLGADGSTNTTATLNGKISMTAGTYNTSRYVTAAANTNWQVMQNVYGPAYGSNQTISSPAITIGTRDGNATSNPIYWKADIYDYDPAGTAGNGTLLWSTTGTDESHPNTPAAKALTFTAPAAKDIVAGHRLKAVISCRMTSTNSSARFYWGSTGGGYSFMSVAEAATAANSVTVTNLVDYNGGGLASLLQGEQGVAMMKFDMYANAATNWTGGKLDKIGSNPNLGDVTFDIYQDANGNGAFDIGTDTKIGGPYSFSQATGSGYTLLTPQTLTSTPQRYFIIYDVSATAATATTVGSRIADASYFTVTNGLTVNPVTTVSSSQPTINGTGAALAKGYAADWDSGTTLLVPEAGGPSATNSACVSASNVTDAIGVSNVGLLNYPGHSCTSTTTRYHASSEANPKFVTLYFNGVSGYATTMSLVKGISFRFRASASSYTTVPVFTVTMFYVEADGTRVNAPISATIAPTAATTTTLSLAGQDFTDVPAGSRLGLQIGVSKSGCRIVLGGAIAAQLNVEETAAVSNGVSVSDGQNIPNSLVLASSADNVVDSFALTSPRAANTVTSITVKGNATTNSSNVGLVKLYADNGTTGVLDPSDVQIGSGTFTGNTAVISGLNEVIGSTYKNYLIAYDIAAAPTINSKLTGTVTALGGATLDFNGDSSSATLTTIATTTVTNGSSEPASLVTPAGGAPVNMDAFGLKVDGGANDVVNTVTVSLLPAGISARVASVDIVDRATGTIVYGSLTAPTSGDDWRVSTSGLAATQAITECYVRIASKANLPTTTTFNVSGLVTAVTHLQTSNGLIVADSTSSTISMDAQPPTDPVLSAATSGTTPGAINLSWTAASDSNGLRPAAYTLARGPVNAPAPVDCSGSGGSTIAYSGPLASFIDSGLAEDQIYAYRVCASDVVNNTSAGTTAAAKAKLTVACNQTPTVLVSPYSKYVKPGDAAQYQVTVTNNDAGFCPDATFTFAIVGAENSTDFITPSTFSPASLTAAANGGGGGTTLTVTAKADAAQGALNSFIVRVTSPTNPTKDAPAPVQTSVNSLAKMLHNSINIGVKSYGDWGTAYDCNTCHAKYTTNIKKVSTSVASPTGARPVVFSAISAPAAVTSGVFGNDHRPGTTSQNICEVCHHRTRFHQYSTSKIANLDHSPSSDCMKCHPHNGGFGFVGGAQCDDCHGDPPTTVGGLAYPPSNALGTTATNAGAHDRHNVLLMTCTTCHSSYSVVDNYMTIGFAVNNTNYPGFNGSVTTGTFTGNSNLNTFYRWTTSAGTTLATAPNTTTCNIYCHGWPGGGGSANATSNPPSWIGASQAACGTCHDATGLNPPTAGSHVKHAGGSGANNNIPCATCHGPSAANHGNGQVEWNLSAVSPSATYKGSTVGTTGAPAPTSSFSYGNCSLVYCHSSVQGATNPALGTGGPTSYGSPTWGDAPQVCGSCHRDMYSDPAATGGHVQHAQNPDTLFDCRICHSSGGTTNPNNHANTNIDVVFSGVGANTVYSQAGSNPPGNGYGNCSNSDCHGRQTTTWGPPTALPLCDKCHGSATTAAFYGTAGPGSTTLKTDKYVGAHDQHIKSAPYNYTTAPDCAQCHIKPAGPYSPGHLDTPLPAEITFSAVAKAGTFYGYTSLPAYNSTTGQCSNTWCHGAGMPSNQGTGVYGSVVVDGGTLGTPATPKWDQPFLTGVASNDCTRCHSYPPAAPTAGYTHYNKLPTDCNSCHNNVNLAGTGFIDPSLHVNGTIDGGCVSCHGNPPIDTAGLTIPALNALSPANAGGHNAHLLNPAIANNCYACHNGYTSQMPSNTLQMGFNAYGGKVTSGTFYGYSTLTNNVYVSSSAGTTVRRTNNAADQNTCASVYCHGGGTATKPVIGGGTNIVPGWEFGAAEVTCGTCHGVSTTSAPTAGSHARHALSGGTSLGLSCDVCHGVKVNNYHVNGSVEWSLKRSDSRIGPLATYNNLSSGGTGNIGPSAVFSSCSNLYCHSNVQGAGGIGAPSAYTTQQWGVAAPLGCAACHKDMASDASGTGSHPRHARTQGYSCNSCHNAAGSTTAKHADHSIDISFSGGAAGTSYTAGSHQAGSGAYGSCSASYCHSNVQGANGSGVPTSYKTTPAWGNAAALACSACHTDMTTSGSGTHLKHTASYLCATCHSGAGHDTTKHADGYIDVTFSGAGAGTTYTQARTAAGSDGYGTCSNIACHYNGSATWGGASLACVSCHPLATLQANGAHGKHISAAPTFYNYTANRSTAGAYDFGCSNCHPLDPLNNHANGSVNVTLNATNTGGGGNVGSLRARNNATADGLAAGNGPSGIYGTTKVSVRCSAAYCHSNGYAANLQYMITPDWYGPAYTGDKCAMCHGNSPNANDPVNQPGSPAHYSKNFLGFANVSGGHLRGIHTNQIFTGSAGLAPVGNTTTGSHGNAGTSTTINCNICHNKTVTSSANDKNMACVSCHSSLPKNPAELIADKRFHVSGNVDVAFASIRVKSKAQLRGSSYDAAIWSRQVGYKAAGAYDAAFKTFTTATQWDGATKTCSNISCHNGKTVKWGDTGGTTFCVSCHTSL